MQGLEDRDEVVGAVEARVAGVLEEEADAILQTLGRAFARAASIESSSASMPSTTACGYALAIAMLDHPSPQPRSATHAPGRGDEPCVHVGDRREPGAPSSLMNIARFSSAMPSRVSSP